MATSTNSHDYGRFDELAEEFAQRYRRGERPSVEEYVARLPAMADEIREMFPALVEVERVEKDAREDGLRQPPAVPFLKEFGDYRLLREVGRGGMGVVYEAEQISLGRRVALKVLPRQVSGDRAVRERFRREARAAARLHHTNIVPVFEVGAAGDVCYYAMQFIQGQGLDLVYDELRRLRGRAKEQDATGARPIAEGTATQADRAAVGQVVQSLLTGRFGDEPPTAQPGRAGMVPATVAGRRDPALATGVFTPVTDPEPALART
jgi:hypothetical protein